MLMNTEKMLTEGRISHFDIIASRTTSPNMGLFLAASLRQGHTAITIRPFAPSVAAIFSSPDVPPLSEGDIQNIEQNIAEELAGTIPGLTRHGDYIAFEKNAEIERQLACEILRLANGKVPPVMGENMTSLNAEQQLAVQRMGMNAFSIVTGGPGTGKTHTAKAFLNSIPGSRVALLAPTGRAVQNLASGIGELSPKSNIEAKTIHRAIRGDERALLPHDVIIIDECSMIDTTMMVRLFRKIPTGARLILLGDTQQLPSIEPGQPLYDIVASNLSCIPVTQLVTCHRTGSEELQRFFSCVSKTDVETLSQWTSGLEVSFLPYTTDTFWKTIDTLLAHHPELYIRHPESPQSHIIVAPEKRGAYGSDAINAYISSLQRNVAYKPIVICKNSYDLDVMNGDLGLIETQKEIPLIHFSKKTVPAVLCPRHELAYAITVHKSQGSEFHTVCCIIPPQGEYDVKMVYTAVSRGKKRLIFVGSPQQLCAALCHQIPRVTLLPYYLKEKQP